jgi:hypothetical protein
VYASDAAGLIDFGSAEEEGGEGKGCWVAKEGRDSLPWLVSALIL